MKYFNFANVSMMYKINRPKAGGVLSRMEPTIYFQMQICVGQSPGFGEYIFPRLHACAALVLSADCTEGSCSSTRVIFNNFLVFNFLFFSFKQEFPLLWMIIPPFSMLQPLSTKCL